eukprot:2114836-Karenia_brevis.AAC.1
MKRITGARARAPRVGQGNRVNERATAIYHTGVWPAATYGAEGIRYFPTMVNTIRSRGADAVASTKQGRCPIILVAIGKGPRWDPYVMGPTTTIMELVGM